LLAKAHNALLEATAQFFKRGGVDPASIPPPTKLAVGVWSRPYDLEPIGPVGYGYTAPTKVYYSPEVSGTLEVACGVDGLSESEYRSSLLQPFGEQARVFLANNDWVALNSAYLFGDWAEESLLMSERALHRLKVAKPAWLSSDYYEKEVAGKAWK